MGLLCKGIENIDDYKHQFENSLFKAKGSALVLLIFISIMYQTINRNKKFSKTLLSSRDGKKRVLIDSAMTSVFGIVSALFVIVLRNGVKRSLSLTTVKNLSLIALILGLFCFAMEASGLNRYLAEKETQNNQGLYFEIDQAEAENANLSSGQTSPLLEPVYNNDPFISSTGYVLILIIVSVIILYCLNMFRITRCGYRNGVNDLSTGSFFYKLGMDNASRIFIAELIIVGVLNCIPPFVSPAIRSEKITAKSSAVAVFTLFVASCLQFMFQYSGIFHKASST